MNIDLTKLAEEISRITTVHSSAVMLIKKLAKELEDITAQLTAKAAEVPPSFDPTPLNDLIDKLRNSTDGLAFAIEDSVNVIPMKEVVMNADDPTVPTVSVTMPEIMPEMVTVTAEVLVDKVDPASPEPQVAIVVEAASNKSIANDVVTDVIKTDDISVDVTVTADAMYHEEIMKETKVDIIAEVVHAFNTTPEVMAEFAPESPATVEVVMHADDSTVPTVSVTMPEVMPEIVTVTAEVLVDKVDPTSSEPQVAIVVEAIPAAEALENITKVDIDIIETDDGQVDVVIAAPVSIVDDIAKVNVDVLEEVKAAFEAAPDVVAEPIKE